MTCSKRTFMALAWHLRAILLVPLALATPLADAQPGAQQTPFSAFVPPDINAPPKGDWPVTFSSPQGDAPGVTIPGAAQPIRMRFSFRRSCCSKRRSRLF